MAQIFKVMIICDLLFDLREDFGFSKVQAMLRYFYF